MTCPARCRANTIEQSNHMAAGNCYFYPAGEFAPDGVEKRCETNVNGSVGKRFYYDDGDSLCEKVDAAAAAQPKLGGISYWQLGFEPLGFWSCVKNKFP